MEKDKMNAYEDFAYVYDELMDATPYEEWCNLLVELIDKYGVSKPRREKEKILSDGRLEIEKNVEGDESCPTGTKTFEEPINLNKCGQECSNDEFEDALETERNLVVDLGCGTGTLTEMMYRRGYDMIGVDNSESMLGVAMEKREQSGDEILYLLQDMRELELYSTVGTVISVCDSVNYILEEEELLETFRLVNNYLYPGGIFIFDFNTDYKYREVIGDTTIAENREDCSFIWENYYDPEEGMNEYDLTIFVQEDGEHFRRFQETHLQRGYEVEQMRSLVEQAGLKIVEVLDADTGMAVTPESERVYIVAKEWKK